MIPNTLRRVLHEAKGFARGFTITLVNGIIQAIYASTTFATVFALSIYLSKLFGAI